MRTRRAAATVMIGLVAVLGGVACGGVGNESSSAGQNSRPEAAAGAAPAAKDAAAGGTAGTGGGAQQQQPVPAGQRAVVRSAQLSLEVSDVYAVARQVSDTGTRYGGYVSDEKTDDRGASIELKVAADRLDEALTALSGLGDRVVHRAQQAQDVTEQVVDVEARLASQRASVERVRALLSEASAIGEIVQVESELTRRQAELESLEQRAAALKGQVELATVAVQLVKPGGVAVDADDTGFLAGLATGWRAFLASSQILLTVAGALLPFAVALSVPVAVVLWLRRRRRPVPAVPQGQSAGS